MDVSCKNLTKIFGLDSYALRSLDLHIESGDFTVVMGESGSGKSTLLRVIAGLEKCTSGEVFFDGVPMSDVPAEKRNIAMVFQQYVLYPNMSVYENLGFYDKSHGLNEVEVDAKVRSVASLLGLTSVLNRKPKYLSGGQQQRVALAKALLRSPDIILFDEPLSNVDEASRSDYEDLLIALKRKLPKTTFIYVTHKVDEALKLARHIAVLNDGGLIAYGTPEEVIKNPQNTETTYILAGDKAEIQGGVLYKNKIVYDGGEVELSDLLKESINEDDLGEVLLAKKFFGLEYPVVFDKNGVQIGGLKNEYFLKGTLGNETLTVGGVENALDSAFLNRIIDKKESVYVKIKAGEIHYFKCDGDFEINSTVTFTEGTTTVFSTQSGKIALRTDRGYKAGDNVKLYFPSESTQLYSVDKQKITSKYEIKQNAATAIKLPFNRLKTGKSILCFKNKILANQATVIIPPDAFTGYSKRRKNSILVRACLDEDVLGEEKLVYVVVDGFNNYVTVKIDSQRQMLKRKQFFLAVDLDKIIVKYGHNKK